MTDNRQPAAIPPPSDAPRTPRWWKWLGLRRRNGRWLRIGLTRWGIALAALILFVAGGAGFAEYSMQPEFCRSCHLMEPYYQAWHDSTHRHVPCGDCHFEPGWRHTVKGKFEASAQAVKFITGTYGSKPHAEVRDSSCTRDGCHERRLLEGGADWTVTTQRGQEVTIRFDHTPHLEHERRGKQLRCVSCHSQLVQGQHIVVTLDTCFLCHMKGFEHGRNEETLGGCKACHDAPKNEIRLATGMFNHAQYLDRGVTCENCHSDTVRGDGLVPRQVCWNCHNQPRQIARYGETSFLHQKHVTDRKVECSSCHIQIEHHLDAARPRGHSLSAHQMLLPESGTCGQCHQQSHNAPAQIYAGTGGRGVPDMPSPMFRSQVDCIACHQTTKRDGLLASMQGQTFLVSEERCNYCHGPKYNDLLEQWRTAVKLELAAAEAQLEAARQALGPVKLTPTQTLALQRLLDDAEHNIRLVQTGRGAHNPTYAGALLSVAVERATQVLTELGVEQTVAAETRP